jgi:hypothetical protein
MLYRLRWIDHNPDKLEELSNIKYYRQNKEFCRELKPTGEDV